MKIQFIILPFFFLTLFIIAYAVEAAENAISTSSIDQLISNEVFGNFIEKVKNFIEFVDNNLLGVIFLIFISFFVWHYWIRNFYTMWKFKRERVEKKKNYRIARCKEENTKDRIYLVIYGKKDKQGGGKYYRIMDTYTLKELGFSSGDDAPRNGNGSFIRVRKDLYKKDRGKYEKLDEEVYKKANTKEFSKNHKKLGRRIKLYDIKRDIMFIFSSAQKIKELKKDIKDM